MEDLKPIIAKNIIDLRRAADITQAQLAEKLNYSDKAVSKWERGEAIPGITTLKEIADLFGVTVDYLISAEHETENQIKREFSERQRRNHLIITLLSTTIVWLVATIIYVIISLSTEFRLSKAWLVFVFAVPVSCVITLVFNSIWGKKKRNFLIISLLLWTVLISFCLVLFLSLQKAYFWLVLAIGIPSQIMILLSSGLKFRRNRDK
ncbi:MAG: helix-turn-helix transcriptional regulator [Clostridia bacterium]|nr:helix-turn-helix transcriptional regulator [Clostridia bacterium]